MDSGQSPSQPPLPQQPDCTSFAPINSRPRRKSRRTVKALASERALSDRASSDSHRANIEPHCVVRQVLTRIGLPRQLLVINTTSWPPALLSRLESPTMAESPTMSGSSEVLRIGHPVVQAQVLGRHSSKVIESTPSDHLARYCRECESDRPISWFIDNRRRRFKLVPDSTGCLACRRAAKVYRDISIHSEYLAEAERLVTKQTANLVEALNLRIESSASPHLYSFTEADLNTG